MTLLFLAPATAAALAQSSDEWLTWSAARAQGIGKAAYVTGRVGGLFDTRLLKTERSYNYKLAATWMTPDVVRASVKALTGTLRRNYDYDRSCVVFPLTHEDGAPLFPNDATGAELVVRIHDREGRVKWPIPESIRARQR